MIVHCVLKGHTNGYTYFFEELIAIFKERDDALKFIKEQLNDPDNYFDTHLDECEKLILQEFEVK